MFFIKSCLAIFLLVAVVLFTVQCASKSGISTVSSNKTKKPAWVSDHPSSPDFFIGIGSAEIISTSLGDAQEKSRSKALQDIAQQIEVSIISDVSLNESHAVINDLRQDSTVFRKKVQTMAQAVLQDWEVRYTWQDPTGHYWTQIILDKQKYYSRVNKKVNDAITLAVNALGASQSGSLFSRISELRMGAAALDDFLGSAMKATVGGRELILNTEVPRRLQQLLSGVEIKPNVRELKLKATELVPETLGVYIFINGQKDTVTPVLWSASCNSVSLQNLPARPDGLHPVIIKPVPASAGIVTISAEADLGNLRYELLQQKFALPSGSFVVSRSKPNVMIIGNDFCKLVEDRLASAGALVSVQNPALADYKLECTFTPDTQSLETMGMFKARGSLAIKLIDSSKTTIMDLTKEIAAMARQSPEQAQCNLKKVAVDEAVKKIEGAF